MTAQTMWCCPACGAVMLARHQQGHQCAGTAWKVEQPSRYGGTHVYYFRTRADAFAYATFMEDYGARGTYTEVPAAEVTEFQRHPMEDQP